MSSKDFTRQNSQAQSIDSINQTTSPNPSLPQSNQDLLERLAALREQSNQVNSSTSMVSAGNALLGPSLQNWQGTQNARFDQLSELMRGTNSQNNLQMPNGNMSYADIERASRLSRTQGNLVNNQRGLAATANGLGNGQQLLGKGLKGAGILNSALGGFTDTGLDTTEGRIANTAAQVGGSQIAGRAMPLPVALTDLAVSTVMKSPLGESMGIPEVVQNTSIGGTVSDSVTAATSLTEAVTTGNTAGAERFHEESIRGDRGVVLQTASSAGEALDSVMSGNTADYVEKADRGDYGPVAQFGNALGKGAHNFLFGDAEQAPEDRKGVMNIWGLLR